jgi:signal transduction histidine kinase
VSEYARELLRVDRCALLLGQEPESLTLAYLSGPPLEGLELGRKADLESLRSRAIPEALRVRGPVVICNADADRRGNPDLARIWDVRSVLLVPLIAHGRILGVLLASRNTTSAWDEGEVELANALAKQAAVAIENADLFQEARDALYRIQQAQDSMMRNERLAAVGTLASSLAHEVRNPLNSINLQLVLLSRRLERLEASNRAEMEALIDSAKKEIARLNGLVEEFLSLSTLDRISLSEVFPREVVQEALELMAPVAHQRGITVGNVHEGPSLRVRLDPEKMKQVLINLIRNALEAMTEGGKLTVTTRATEDAYLIEVADSGVGIEPGKEVFDFFVTTKKGGTGLGLPIAKRIVEAHGGTLSYRSEPGKGTIFSIALGDEMTRE